MKRRRSQGPPDEEAATRMRMRRELERTVPEWASLTDDERERRVDAVYTSTHEGLLPAEMQEMVIRHMVRLRTGSTMDWIRSHPDWREPTERIMAEEMGTILERQLIYLHTHEFEPIPYDILQETADFIRGQGIPRALPFFRRVMRGRYATHFVLTDALYARYVELWPQFPGRANDPPPPAPLAVFDALMEFLAIEMPPLAPGDVAAPDAMEHELAMCIFRNPNTPGHILPPPVLQLLDTIVRQRGARRFVLLSLNYGRIHTSSEWAVMATIPRLQWSTLAVPLSPHERAIVVRIFAAFFLREFRVGTTLEYLPRPMRKEFRDAVPVDQHAAVENAVYACLQQVIQAWAQFPAPLMSVNMRAFWVAAHAALLPLPLPATARTWQQVLPPASVVLREWSGANATWARLWIGPGVDTPRHAQFVEDCLAYCNDDTVPLARRVAFLRFQFLIQATTLFTIEHVRSFYRRLAPHVLDAVPATIADIFIARHADVSAADLWRWQRPASIAAAVGTDRRLFDPLRNEQAIVRALLLDSRVHAAGRITDLLEAMPPLIVPLIVPHPGVRWFGTGNHLSPVMMRKLVSMFERTDGVGAIYILVAPLRESCTDDLQQVLVQVMAHRGPGDTLLRDLFDQWMTTDADTAGTRFWARTALARAVGRPDPPMPPALVRARRVAAFRAFIAPALASLVVSRDRRRQQMFTTLGASMTQVAQEARKAILVDLERLEPVINTLADMVTYPDHSLLMWETQLRDAYATRLAALQARVTVLEGEVAACEAIGSARLRKRLERLRELLASERLELEDALAHPIPQ